MFIQYIEMENWKCYRRKTKFVLEKHKLLSERNGTGKTSLLEAIHFAIWGKAPMGFNFNTVRTDDSKPCRIFISFLLNHEEYTIERIFGGDKPLSELRVQGNLVCESVRAIEQWMNSVINMKISNQFWTSSLIQSEILKSDFFTKTILEDVLKDPMSIIVQYKSALFQNNKIINRFDENILDAKALKNQMEDIKSKLKKKNDGDINLAKAAQEAASQLSLLKKQMQGEKRFTTDQIRQWKKATNNLQRNKQALEEELKKKDNRFSQVNASFMKKIMQQSKADRHCLVCGKKLTEKEIASMEMELSLSGRSEETIKNLQEQVEIARWDAQIIQWSEQMDQWELRIRQCPFWESIIQNYHQENEQLWKEFDDIQKKYSLALKQQEELKHIQELKAQNEEIKIKKAWVEEWVENASFYYSNQLLEKASQYIQSTNSRYKQITLYENEFWVVVENPDDHFALNMLPVSRLSTGEKTMVSLFLLFATHNILVPELPMIFDETFGNLDRENLEQVQKFLRKQDCQILVVTHSKEWQEF